MRRVLALAALTLVTSLAVGPALAWFSGSGSGSARFDIGAIAASGCTTITATTGSPGSEATFDNASCVLTVPRGDVGPSGAQGAAGLDGATGPAGTPGTDCAGATPDPMTPRTCPGVQGPKGDTGAQGPKGDTGATGPAGADGAPGPQGPAGANGADGAPGATGATGPAGPSGVVGRYIVTTNVQNCSSSSGSTCGPATVSCNAGDHVLSGGAFAASAVVNPNTSPTPLKPEEINSWPSNSSGNFETALSLATSWSAESFGTGTTGGVYALNIFAVCAVGS